MSDLILWKSMKEGDRIAFEKIYREHFGFLYNYSIKIIADSSMVEDCIQDLFLEIWNKREKLSDTDSIRKYLTVSIRRKIIKAQKKSRIVQMSSDKHEVLFKAEIDIEHRIVEIEGKNELTKKLRNSFQSLSDRQKEALYLKFYGGMKNQEIADVLNINYQSVRNLISRSVKMLSEKMKLFLLC